MLTYLLHGGRQITLSYVMKIKMRTKNSSISGMVLVCVMKFKSLYLAFLISVFLQQDSEEKRVFGWQGSCNNSVNERISI